jgi:peptide alpha-N-acetyltransferase
MAIEHTSTVTEFYIIKAEIQYKMHKNVQCLKTIDEARKTDLADRYMNNICIKYLLKCMKPSIA